MSSWRVQSMHGQPGRTTCDRQVALRMTPSAWQSMALVVAWRRRWDLNPRKVSLHTISNRADSAALALLLIPEFTFRK